ncbi:phosphopantothenoylcysteine decarboxylase [Patella vulgata]|uniref:phosphopantothenoylcysteine decarboxylase n=1 Tax=Patella vulgata TaxID=6465 RepID=UPI00217FBEE9|nr:phosphopantothenoylcysteine decarboxylase [Patella vulgata]XP_050402843.1 phosphopantothenoylcysteine decarboxylase [Patella vulgata]XP_050402844.1 phosphopantothenoylcysteine decarboxylase [Patella vulgata]XP_050402845.1 phosphopantothenoylcysteine decarboxylase [Patella vulgata]
MVKYNVLVGCTGSVASLKIPLLIGELAKSTDIEIDVKLISTEHALHFFDKSSIKEGVLTDVDEWNDWQKRGDPVLHIELRRWADLMLIAPLDANTLAKISNGICDNLLTCVVRAWDLSRPLLFAPAMNTYMWNHPLTSKQINILKAEFQYIEIPCIEKTLICGDTGKGAMAEVSTIVSVVIERLKEIKKETKQENT